MRDILYLQNGEEVSGKLVKISRRKVLFQKNDGLHKYDRDDILSIDIQKSRDGDHWRKVSDIDDKLLKNTLENLPKVENYPDASYISLLEKHVFQVYSDGSSRYSHRQIDYILEERAKHRGRAVFDYFKDNQQFEIDFARTVSSDKSLFHLDDSALEYGQPHGRIPEYNRLIRSKFALGETRIGSIIDYKTTLRQRKVDFANPFSKTIIAGGFEPIEKLEIECLVHKGQDNRFHYFLQDIDKKFDKEIVADSLIKYSLQLEENPNISREDFMPPLHTALPYIMIGFGDSFDKIAHEYQNAIFDSVLDKTLYDQIQLMISEANANKIRTAKNIYELVIENVQLKGPEFKEFSIIPTPPDEVWKKGYGNYLDINFLLYTMMNNAELDVKWGFLTSREIAFSKDVPTVSIFAIPAVYYQDENESYVLSIDSEYRHFGSFRRECSEGIFWNALENEFIEHDFSPFAENISNISASLDSMGNLYVKFSNLINGLPTIELRKLKQKTKQELDKYIKMKINEFHPAAELVSYHIDGIASVFDGIDFEITYRIPNYATLTKDKMIFRLPQLKHTSWGGSGQSRNLPIYFENKKYNRFDMEITVPVNYSIYNEIEEIDFDEKGLSFSANLYQKDDKIIYKEDEALGRLFYPADFWDEYRLYNKFKTSLDEQYIILKKQ
ncbi:MAG: DUF3857 domain-containing protein [Candidatus Zixiibacteriota bacterium]